MHDINKIHADISQCCYELGIHCSNHIKIIGRKAWFAIEKLHMVVVDLDYPGTSCITLTNSKYSATSFIQELQVQGKYCKIVLGRKVGVDVVLFKRAGLVCGIIYGKYGEREKILSQDESTIAMARSFLLDECPEEVMLEYLFEKFPKIQKEMERLGVWDAPSL